MIVKISDQSDGFLALTSLCLFTFYEKGGKERGSEVKENRGKKKFGGKCTL